MFGTFLKQQDQQWPAHFPHTSVVVNSKSCCHGSVPSAGTTALTTTTATRNGTDLRIRCYLGLRL